jgi:hypothetical protein
MHQDTLKAMSGEISPRRTAPFHIFAHNNAANATNEPAYFVSIDDPTIQTTNKITFVDES